MRKLILGLLALSLCGSGILHAEAFTEDFEAAITKAEKEKKDLLIDFTGSDWCPVCVKLKEDVLGQADFQEAAQKNFVLVELDFPHEKKQNAKIKDQNLLLAKAFGVEAFPTIILADAQGRGYARTGYMEGGVAPYLKHLDELRAIKAKRDEVLDKAAKAEGIEKAKLYDQALSVVPADARVGYDELLKEIYELDSENKAGLKGKYESERLYDNLRILLEKGDAVASMQSIVKLVEMPEATPTMKQQVLFWKAQLLNSQGDKKGVLEALEAAQKVDPDSEYGKQITQLIEQKKKDAEAPKAE